MAPPHNAWYAAAPTMVSPPQQPPPSRFFDNSSPASAWRAPPANVFTAGPAALKASMQSASSTSSATAPTPTPTLDTAPLLQQQQQQRMEFPLRPHALAGRKRSRDEISSTLASELAQDTSLDRPPSPPKKPAAEPIYGPGMTLLYPDDPGYAIAAGSQTGTWAEERAEQASSNNNSNSNSRPSVNGSGHSHPDADDDTLRPMLGEPRKSQRLDRTAGSLDDIALAAVAADPRTARLDAPIIDEATRTLGIAWTTLPADPDSQAAARGWARYIENHFPLRAAALLWRNNALPAYLVRGEWSGVRGGGGGDAGGAATASSCGGGGGGVLTFWLFDEDLGRCRLVARSWERTLDCLRTGAAESDVELVAASASASEASAADMNGFSGGGGAVAAALVEDGRMDID